MVICWLCVCVRDILIKILLDVRFNFTQWHTAVAVPCITLCLGAHYALVSFLFQIHLFVSLIQFYLASHSHNTKLNRSQQWSYTSFLARSGHSISIVLLSMYLFASYCVFETYKHFRLCHVHTDHILVQWDARLLRFAQNRFHHNVCVLHHTTICLVIASVATRCWFHNSSI